MLGPLTQMIMDRFPILRIVGCCLAASLPLTACRDHYSPVQHPEIPTTPEPGEATPQTPLDLVYVCGNKFLVTNATPSATRLVYRVAGTGETGSIELSPGSQEDPGFSEAELETKLTGVVELYQDDSLVARRINEGSPCGAASLSASVAASGTPATSGSWSAPFAWPMIGVHVHLLPTGKVLTWGKNQTPYVWDPAAGTFTAVSISTWLFCSGHTFLSDGRLLVNGGHIANNRGVRNANLFDPVTMQWSARASMAKGRWYPTTITLASGQALTIAGADESEKMVTVPEVWTGTGWRPLTSAGRLLPYYPRMFVAPNGKVFYAGELRATAYLSTSGTGTWTPVGNRLYGVRNYGSAVMYQPGKILYVGGGYTTETAEIIDLNRPSPQWQWTGSMAVRRRHLNATILPDGKVLVTGGTSGTTFSDEATGVHAAELWNPNTGTWTTLASNAVTRVYHSTSLLLPDGRVLHAGSGDAASGIHHRNGEIFSPPYLFMGARPRISTSPSRVNYGATFQVATPDASTVTRVTWVRLGSVTHAFDMNQRFNELSFGRVDGALNVTAPASRNLAPPGHYLMFLLNGKDVPSVAKIVRIN